ncbi:MAG: Superoxide dismutase [Fe] [Chlamydiae bacterium]|nr:Superoxide dismutase [Fe] [Chlamydiota bacterium]
MKHLAIILATIFFSFFTPAFAVQNGLPHKAMEYQAEDFSHLIGMPGFSDDLLKMHFTLYRGYVKNTNLLIQLIREYAVQNKTSDYQYQALKRRFGWEFDGMRLHELYFSNLGGKKPLDRSTSLYQLIDRDFGSYDNWKKDFIATGMMRGIGWAILYFDPKADRLFNTWINEHDLGHLADGAIILVMDVWEHAYMPQYGLDRGKYIDAFFRNIDWDVVATRFHNAVTRR